MNRLTITLPDEIYNLARAYSIAEKTSLSKAIVMLMTRNSASPPLMQINKKANSRGMHPRSGFPISMAGGENFTSDSVRCCEDDEDLRIIEQMKHPKNPTKRSR